MKNFKRILALVLSVLMVMSIVVVGVAAEDEVTTYNEQSIARLNKLGIFKGSTSGDMHANDNVTREQMSLFVGRVMTGKTATNYWESYQNATTFEDIDDEADEYVGAIAYAYENGVVIGKSAERFDPKGNVSYQDALVMAVRSLGYTGLQYPNGYINKAIKLGLTNGISGVAYTDAAIRGVIATILYNALYAEDSLFAENFNLTSGLYMLVAAPATTTAAGTILPAATIDGYDGEAVNAGYVAFAPLNDNFRADHSKYVYAKTSQLTDDITVNFANRLGYGYELTFENNVLTWADECATKTFVNYGDDREITSSAVKYYDKEGALGANTYVNDFLTFGGVKYTLTDKVEPDFTSPTATKDLILYNVGNETAVINEYKHITDAAGNVVDAAGNILLYKRGNAYYVQGATIGTFVEATAQQIHDAMTVVSGEVSSEYTIYTQPTEVLAGQTTAVAAQNIVKTIANNYFCEITAIDYNNDGEYEAAIYSTYRVGTVKGLTDINGDGKADFHISGDNTLPIHHNVTYADYKVLNGSFVQYLPIVYKFNRLNNEITIIKTVTAARGLVNWATKGTVAPASTIYENSQVRLGTDTYKVGGWTDENLNGISRFAQDDAWRLAEAGLNGRYTNTFETGWNDILYESMNADKYDNFIGFAVGGHLIAGCPLPKAAVYNYDFVAFDPLASDLSVDNGKIVVKAITDASGIYRDIKIDSIDDIKIIGIQDMAYLNWLKMTLGSKYEAEKILAYFADADLKAKAEATQLYKDLLRTEILAEIGADINSGAFLYGIKEINADGSYDLTTTAPANYVAYPNRTEISFTLGISSDPLDKGADNAITTADTVIATTAKTVFTFVVADGIYTYVGQPKDTYTLDLSASTTKLYVANANQIMVIDLALKLEDIAKGDADWSSTIRVLDTASGEYKYVYGTRDHVRTWAVEEYKPSMVKAFNYDAVYVVTEKSAMKETYRAEDGTMLYFYSNLYNLVTGEYEASVMSADRLPVYNTSVVATNYGTIIAMNDGVFVKSFAIDEYKAYNDELFHMYDNQDDADDAYELHYATFISTSKEQNGNIAHVVTSAGDFTVKSVNFTVVYSYGSANAAGVKAVEIGDFSKIAAGATMYYIYDAVAGTLTGFAFN